MPSGRTTRLSVLTVLALGVTDVLSGPLGRQAKRSRSERSGTFTTALASAGEALQGVAELFQLRTPLHVYSMRRSGDYEGLIDFLWTGDYLSAAGRFTAANPALVNFFETQSLDDQMPRPDNMRRGERGLERNFFQRFEGTFRAIFRARSHTLVPYETAALSVMFLQHRVPHIAWNAISQLSRAVMTQYWTEELCEAALLRDPGPRYPIACGISAAVFDNFMMKIGYGSYVTRMMRGDQIRQSPCIR